MVRARATAVSGRVGAVAGVGARLTCGKVRG